MNDPGCSSFQAHYHEPSAAGSRAFVIQYDIEGVAGGTFHVQVEGGHCRAFEGAAAAPDVCVAVSDADWLTIQHGTLDSAQAFTAYAGEAHSAAVDWRPRGRLRNSVTLTP